MSHPFVIGGQYRNSKGIYTVQAIADDRMTIRYVDGSVQNVNIDLQARIWQRIQDEENPPVLIHRSDDYESMETQPVADLVETILNSRFSKPYPNDITDQVCLSIEQNTEWLERYSHLVEHFSSTGKDGKSIVNNAIGYFTKDLTGMTTVKKGVPSKSTLIKSFSLLDYPGEITT